MIEISIPRIKRYAMIRATYRQTIRALSRVTEVGGYTETGHARRVCDISLAVGREMGMAENDLLNLEYAALMHDIGQLSLDDPIPGGATVVAAPYQQRQIADKGADVIVETGVLDEVAHIVRHIPDPYRRPQEVADKSMSQHKRETHPQACMYCLDVQEGIGKGGGGQR